MHRTFLLVALAAALLAPVRLLAQPDTSDTRLLHMPAVSARHVAFIYADDLWVADVTGGPARRLTSDQGVEAYPVFSPDGRTLAFSAE
jgi:tricorn protease